MRMQALYHIAKKRINILAIVPIVLMLMAFLEKKPHTDIYQVDTKQSTLEWYASKLTGRHNGTIQISEGMIENSHGNFGGNFVIDMRSLEDTDMKPGGHRTSLENHLKSADFFDVEKFPKSIFKITSATPLNEVKEGGYTHKITGMLTIKEKTNEIFFDAIIKIEENKIISTGSAIVDRSKFDIKYGSKSFFPNIGDKIIYDDFTLKFNVVAIKKTDH